MDPSDPLAHSQIHNEFHESTDASPNYVIYELRALKYLVFAICVVFCGYLLVKSKIIQRITRKLSFESMENGVLYRQSNQHYNSDHGEELIFHENVKE